MRGKDADVVVFFFFKQVLCFFFPWQGPPGPEGEQGPAGEPGSKVRRTYAVRESCIFLEAWSAVATVHINLIRLMRSADVIVLPKTILQISSDEVLWPCPFIKYGGESNGTLHLQLFHAKDCYNDY